MFCTLLSLLLLVRSGPQSQISFTLYQYNIPRSAHPTTWRSSRVDYTASQSSSYEPQMLQILRLTSGELVLCETSSLHFYPEDNSSKSVRKFGKCLPGYAVSHPRSEYSSRFLIFLLSCLFILHSSALKFFLLFLRFVLFECFASSVVFIHFLPFVVCFFFRRFR